MVIERVVLIKENLAAAAPAKKKEETKATEEVKKDEDDEIEGEQREKLSKLVGKEEVLM